MKGDYRGGVVKDNYFERHYARMEETPILKWPEMLNKITAAEVLDIDYFLERKIDPDSGKPYWSLYTPVPATPGERG